jgi:hypothetical protein
MDFYFIKRRLFGVIALGWPFASNGYIENK